VPVPAIVAAVLTIPAKHPLQRPLMPGASGRQPESALPLSVWPCCSCAAGNHEENAGPRLSGTRTTSRSQTAHQGCIDRVQNAIPLLRNANSGHKSPSLWWSESISICAATRGSCSVVHIAFIGTLELVLASTRLLERALADLPVVI